MNSTAENKARQVLQQVNEPDRVRVRVRVSWRNGICLPDKTGDKEEEAVFAVLTFGDNYAIEKAVTYEKDVDGSTTVQVTDLNEYRRLLVRHNLLSWTLDIPIERDSYGWMTPECYQRVSRIPAPLMEAFVQGFEQSMEITEEEERKISRQCAILFSPTGRGVSDACEAVSLFCTLGNYWEKFGLNKATLPSLPYREYLLLKIMLSKEGDANRVKHHHPASSTKIASAGRSRPSRGLVMPM